MNTSAWPLQYYLLSLNQSHYHDDDRNDKQDVNKPAERVRRDHAKKPQD